MNAFTKDWMRAAAIRSIKTMAQTALASIGTTQVSLGAVNWIMVASTSVVAGIVSILTSIVGLPEVNANNQS